MSAEGDDDPASYGTVTSNRPPAVPVEQDEVVSPGIQLVDAYNHLASAQPPPITMQSKYNTLDRSRPDAQPSNYDILQRARQVTC